MAILLVMILMWVVAAAGWILNIVKIVKSLKANQGKEEPVSRMFIARCIGVFAAPLGVVLGYMK